MGWNYYSYKPSRPIKVEHGIKMKSKRGDIGDTWWSKRWVKVLDSFGWNNRLERGRRYARSGQVLEFKIGSGTIKAKVQGSTRRPYTVTIQIKALQQKEWIKITNRMAEKAIFAAKLLAGEMPKNIEEIFDSVGASLFPKSSKDVKTNCSCPDRANPCKHVAAVHYILAEEFDRNPFMLFEVRGRTRKEITKLLRNNRSLSKNDNNDQLDSLKNETSCQTTEEILSVENFWTGLDLDSFSVNISPPEVPAIIIKRLGPPEFWTVKEDFVNTMSKYYEEISKKALKIAFGGFNEIKKDHEVDENQKARYNEKAVELHDIFKNETGKNAIWGGKETKGYLEWKQMKR